MKLVQLIAFFAIAIASVLANTIQGRNYGFSNDERAGDYRDQNNAIRIQTTRISQVGSPDSRLVGNQDRSVDAFSSHALENARRTEVTAHGNLQGQRYRNPSEGISTNMERPGSQIIRRRVVKKVVPIVRHIVETDHHGTFNLETETGDGIRRVEQGSLKQLANSKPVAVSSGTIAWTSPEGTKFSMSYTADEHGFRPSGDHLPTAPPSPPAILKMLSELPRLSDVDHSEQDGRSSLSSRGQFQNIQTQSSPFDHFRRFPSSQAPVPVRQNLPRMDQNVYEVPRPYHLEYRPSHPYESSGAQHAVIQQQSINQILEGRPSPSPLLPPTFSPVNFKPPTQGVIVATPAPAAQISTSAPPTLFPTRPTHTIIQAPLVPILVGPSPIPLKTLVKTKDFSIDSDNTRTVLRIGAQTA